MAAACDKVKLIVSYGGEIRRCPVSGKARYVGGENRLVKVGLSERLAGLRARLAALAGYPAADVRIRYAIVEEGLDALRDVDSDADLWRLVTLLYYRAAGVADAKDCRVRAFLLLPSSALPPPQPLSLKPPVPCLQHSASSPALLPEVDGIGEHDGDDVASLLMRAQSDGAAYMATGLNRADSGFDALAAIAEEQKNPPSAMNRTDSGLEAVATEQNLMACPAPVLLVPVTPVVTVFYFYPVIPAYTCLVLTGTQSVATRV